MPRRSTGSTHRFEITTAADRHALEALHLEIRRLARKHGVEVTEVRIIGTEPGDVAPRPVTGRRVNRPRASRRRRGRLGTSSRSR